MVDRIGHYRIVAELGRGGMGVVYKAHEESLNRFVAFKVLGEHLTKIPPTSRGSCGKRRARPGSTTPISSRSMPSVRMLGGTTSPWSMSRGRACSRFSGQGTLDSIQAARIVLQTASGLSAAHEQGIIHRDIKPANLMIDERGLVKIADFGLALMTAAVSRLTATGMFMGTPGYLSPEQCLDKDIDHRTDIYSRSG